MTDLPITDAQKSKIDAMSYEELLRVWRFAHVGDERFQGAKGKYWGERMAKLRAEGADHVGASKRIGWDR